MPNNEICLPYSVRFKINRLDNFDINKLSIDSDMILIFNINIALDDKNRESELKEYFLSKQNLFKAKVNNED